MSRSSIPESGQIAEQAAPGVSDAPRAYVIIGTTGEFSDRSEWPVAVVSSEDAAKRYIEALDEQYQRLPPEWRDNYWDSDGQMKAHMSLDPNFGCGYTGTSYFYCECPSLSDARIADLLASAREVKP